jgi:hypothetical protein
MGKDEIASLNFRAPLRKYLGCYISTEILRGGFKTRPTISGSDVERSRERESGRVASIKNLDLGHNGL